MRCSLVDDRRAGGRWDVASLVVTAQIACTPCRVRRDGGDVDRRGRRASVLAARARRRGDPAGDAPQARAGRRDGAHPAVRRQPGHRNARVPRWRAAVAVRHDAGAVPRGRLSRPGQVRLPQRRLGRAGTGRVARPDRVLSLPAPNRLCRAGRRGDGRARGGAAGTRRARGDGRDRRQRPLGRGAAARRPDHRRRSRHGRLLRRPAARPDSGDGGDARRRRSRPGERRRRTRGRVRTAGGRRRRLRPRRPRERDVGRAPAVA